MKKNGTKILGVIITFIMAFSVTKVAFATATVKVTPSSSVVSPGEEISFSITINNPDTKVSGAQGKIDISNNITYVDATRDNDKITAPNGENAFAIAGPSSGAKESLTITYIYTVKSDATPGSEINFTVSELHGTTGDGSASSIADIEGKAVTATAKVAVPQDPSEEKVDKTLLKKAIEDAQALLNNGKKYTDESIANLNKAIDEALKVLNDNSASQEKVDEVTTNVTNAIKALEEVANEPHNPSEVEINKTSLKKAIDEAQKLLNNDKKYTDESLENLNKAIDEALKVLNDNNANQEKVDEVTTNVTNAIKALEEVTNPSENNNSKPSENNNSNISENNNSNSSEKDDVPKTGDVSVIVWPVALLTICSGTALAVILLRKNRLKKN